MSKRLAHNSVFGAISGICYGLAGFVSTILVARLLGAEGTGEVALSLWVALLAATIVDVGLSASLARYIPELTRRKERDQALALVWLVLRLAIVAVLTIMLAFILVFLVNIEAVRNSFSSTVWVLVGVCGVSQFLYVIASGFLVGFQKFKTQAAFSLAKLIVQPAAVFLGAVIAGTEGALVGYAMGYLIGVWCLVGLPNQEAPMEAKLRARVTRYAVYSWAAMITTTLVWGRFELVFLKAFAGWEAVGLFTVAASFTSMVGNILIVITKGLLPHFSERTSAEDAQLFQSHFQTVQRTMALMCFPICIGIAALSGPLLLLLYGKAFDAAIPAAAILLLVSAITVTVGSVGNNVVLALERSDFNFYANLFGAALTILGCLALVPALGLMGAVLVRGTVQLSMVAIALWYLTKVLQVSFPFYHLGWFLFGAILSGASARLVLEVLSEPVSVPIAVVVGAVVYVLFLRITKCVPQEDAERLQVAADNLPGALLPRIARPIMKLVLGTEPLQTSSPRQPRHDTV